MKYLIIFSFAALVAFTYSSPILDQGIQDQRESEDIWVPPSELPQGHVQRFKRGTCDFPSFQTKWFSPNDASCAAHCLIKGFKGGRCKGHICSCKN